MGNGSSDVMQNALINVDFNRVTNLKLMESSTMVRIIS